MLVVVHVLENPDHFAIKLTEQISSIGLFAGTESQCTEDEHDDEDEDDSKFRNLGLMNVSWRVTSDGTRSCAIRRRTSREDGKPGMATLFLNQLWCEFVFP